MNNPTSLCTHKLAELSSKSLQSTYDLLLTTIRVDATYTLLLSVVGILLVAFIVKKVPTKVVQEMLGSNDPLKFMGIMLLIATLLVVLVASVTQALDVWILLGILEPDVVLFHKILESKCN